MATTYERSDPVRNFKFLVEATGADGFTFGEMGFMTVEGIAMDTDMLPYREGGFNTTPPQAAWADQLLGVDDVLGRLLRQARDVEPGQADVHVSSTVQAPWSSPRAASPSTATRSSCA